MNVDDATERTRSDSDVVVVEREGRIVVSADCRLAAAMKDVVSSSVYGSLCLGDGRD